MSISPVPSRIALEAGPGDSARAALGEQSRVNRRDSRGFDDELGSSASRNRGACRSRRRPVRRHRGERPDDSRRTRPGNRPARPRRSSAAARAWCRCPSCRTVSPGIAEEVRPEKVVMRRVAELVDDQVVRFSVVLPDKVMGRTRAVSLAWIDLQAGGVGGCIDVDIQLVFTQRVDHLGAVAATPVRDRGHRTEPREPGHLSNSTGRSSQRLAMYARDSIRWLGWRP